MASEKKIIAFLIRLLVLNYTMKFINFQILSIFCFLLLRGLLKNKIIRIFCLFSAFCFTLSAQENPFIKIAGEPFSQYFESLEKNIYLNIQNRDSVWIMNTASQMREAGKISKNKKWMLEADFFESFYHFLHDQLLLNPNHTQMDSIGTIFIGKMLSIAQQAKKIKAFDIELRAMYRVWDFYAYHLKNYEIAFRYGLEFGKELSKVSTEEFWLRPHYYSEIGKLYYYFYEYETALFYFEKGLEGMAIVHNPSVTNRIKPLLNNKGLIYRNHYNDLEKSDSCFLQILEIEFQNPERQSAYDSSYMWKEYEMWRGIAKGNLGTNCYLRGEYDQAIPLLQYSIEKTLEYNDFNFPYAISKAVLLSEIFLNISDMKQAKLYADTTCNYLFRLQKRSSISDVKTDVELWVDYYRIMSRYYRVAGDNDLALLYADSANAAQTQLEEEYNLRKLLRVEQRINQEKLDAELFRTKTYFRGVMMLSVFSLLLVTLFILLYRSYRKKQDAYRELVNKSQQWAKMQPQPETDNAVLPTILPDSADLSLMEEIERLMTEEKIYKNHSLTLDAVANELGYKPYLVSGAINRCTKKDFSTFVSEYRIKEAIRLLSRKNAHRFSLDGVAFDSGFNDRRNFNRVFKKMTGLTPTEFLRLRKY